jgi:hypothetical protein
MNRLTDPIFRRKSDWCEFETDTYLDRRHPNWILAEELGDVIFVTERRVVLVHRDRAEHIARALGWRPGAMVREQAIALLAITTTRQPAPCIAKTATRASVVIVTARSRWRAACGWLGILAGAAVFVAALAVRLDDPALVMALALGLRGGRLILDVDS